MSVHYRSPKHMQCKVVSFLLILLLKSQLTEESGYNCSKFHGAYGGPLEECPLAKFMLKEHLVECFDNSSKWHDIKCRFLKICFTYK